MKYKNVSDFFVAEWSEFALADYLENSGGFWPRVRDNTITNEELERNNRIGYMPSQAYSRVVMASRALMGARLTGKLPNPG